METKTITDDINIVGTIKKLMWFNSLTIAQLSRDTGISVGAFYSWFNHTREPKLSTCVILADYFNITLDELVFGLTE